MVTKKTAVKKPIKKAVRKTASRKKQAPMRSFRVYKDPVPFSTFKITRQTAYWSVLLLFVMITQLWILRIQIDLANLTNALLLQ
jgi:hypothetical protein